MGVPPYVLSQVMLEEHRHIVTRNLPDPDWPPARRLETPPRLATVRRRLGHALRGIADRLDPAAARPYAVQLAVAPYPGNEKKAPLDRSAMTRKETARWQRG